MCDLQKSVPDKFAYLDETFTEVAGQRLQDAEQGRRGQAAQVDFVEEPRTLSLLNIFLSAAWTRAQHSRFRIFRLSRRQCLVMVARASECPDMDLEDQARVEHS